MKLLIDHINRFVKLSARDERIISEYLRTKAVKNKEYLLSEGAVCSSNYFILKGCLRKYVNTEFGNKQIIQFAIENWWMTDYNSFETGSAAHCNIQAVENSELVVLEKEIQDPLFNEVPLLERYFRIILQKSFEASLNRIHYIFAYSGVDRYHRFSSLFPEFVQRVPQYMLASYLGFTPEFLSKIRAKKG